MDKISKQIIDALKKTETHSLYWNDDLFEQIDLIDLKRASKYLVENKYLEYIFDLNNEIIGVALTHETLHPISVNIELSKRWLFHEWLGGFIIGVTSTIGAQFVMHLGNIMLQWLIQKISQ